MPIYEYQCEDCGGFTERLRISLPPMDHEICQMCGGKDTRVISRPSVIKINGFNEANGYAKKGNK